MPAAGGWAAAAATASSLFPSLRVALAVDEQVLAAVPTAAHDQLVDAVVTPTRTLVAPHAAHNKALFV
jgi:hypothetical protein